MPEMSGNKRKLYKYYFIFVFLLAAVAIAAVAVALEVRYGFFSGKQAQSQVPEELERMRELEGFNFDAMRARAPYVMFRPQANHKGNPITNSFGFHSPEIRKEKAADEYRIAIVGGSAVYTAGPPYKIKGEYLNHSLIGILAKLMRERLPGLANKKLTFINGGIPSAVSGQELAQLTHYVIPMNIDLLVVYDGFNDFYTPFDYDRRPGYPYDYIVEEYRFYKGKTKSSAGTGLNQLLSLYEGMDIVLSEPDDREAPILEKYFFNLAQMAAIANGFGVRTAIFLQPYSERNNALKRGGYVSHLLDLYRAANKTISVLAKGNNPNMYIGSLTTLNRKLDELFIDLAHVWWDPGHQIIAEAMFDEMAAAGMFNDLNGRDDTPIRDLQPVFQSRNLFTDLSNAISAGKMELNRPFDPVEMTEIAALGEQGIGKKALKGMIAYYDGGQVPEYLRAEAERQKKSIEVHKNMVAANAFPDDMFAQLPMADGSAVSSGDLSATFLKEYAFDNDENTYWSSSQKGGEISGVASIGYEFGEGHEATVQRIKLKQGGRVNSFKVQVRSVGGEWKDVLTVELRKSGEWDRIDLPTLPPAGGWRLLANANVGEYPATWTVYEIQLLQKLSNVIEK